jgi:hypothetical protein
MTLTRFLARRKTARRLLGPSHALFGRLGEGLYPALLLLTLQIMAHYAAQGWPGKGFALLGMALPFGWVVLFSYGLGDIHAPIRMAKALYPVEWQRFELEEAAQAEKGRILKLQKKMGKTLPEAPSPAGRRRL